MSGVALNLPQTILVHVNGNEFSVTRGTRVKAFLRRYFPDLEPLCLGAIVGNRLMDLESPITSSCRFEPVTYASKSGARIYRATLTLMLCEAVARLYPDAKVQVGQSLGDGYYFRFFRNPPLTQENIVAIEAEMHAMQDRKEAIATLRVPTQEAIEAFESMGRTASAEIVRAMRFNNVTVATMGKHIDLALGPLLPTVEGIRAFKLSPYAEGMVLGFPPPHSADEAPHPPTNHGRLFSVYRETRSWNKLLGIETVADLNRAVVSGHIREVIRVAEALHERKLVAIADNIVQNKNTRLVLVAGPSSSGKTTTVKRLRMQMLAIGVRPKELNLDNYYVDRDQTPPDESGEPDFECLEAIDLPLLNEHLGKLLAGETVDTPRYSFVRGKRDEKTVPMKLEPGELLLIEGIHGLNERLTEAVPKAQKFRMYVSALTQLSIDDHNRIFTSDARLLRRIVRDRLFRGYSAADTIRMWPKVRAGEEKHIFQFQEEADLMFNSTLVYEPPVLKVFAERFLMEVPESDPAFLESSRLLEFLDLFVPIFLDDIPATSILREFVGGSAFNY